MQKRFYSTISILIFTSFWGISQNFEKRFEDLSANDDTAGQATLLRDWERSNPKDPELFVAYFNFYARKSMTEVVSIDQEKKNEESLIVTDSTGEQVGYIGSSMKYDDRVLQKGFDQIDQGISLYPARLDMRFGKIYMLGEAENFEKFTKTIVETLDYGNEINNAWLWKKGEPLGEAKKFLLDAMQGYVLTIYNAEDNNLLPYMRQISETVLKYFPDHVESLSDLALTYLITGDYDKALTYLLKAETINPKDVIVLNNIAETYKRKGDKVNARAYYEKIIKYGSKEDIQDAKEKMKDL